MAIQPPRNIKELQNSLGTVGCVSQFIPNYAEKTVPLGKLLKKGTAFVWDFQYNGAFQELKQMLTTAPVLRFLDHKEPLVLSADASLADVGAVLLQDCQPIA